MESIMTSQNAEEANLTRGYFIVFCVLKTNLFLRAFPGNF